MAHQPLWVLLVDDNPHDRALAIRALGRAFPSLEVVEIANQEMLDQALAARSYDVVITDFQLLWSDGLQVLRASKAIDPARPVIMFTATGSEEIAVEAMKSGLDDYVLKSPQHYVRLPAAVTAALDRAAIRRRAMNLEQERAELLLREQAARAAAEEAQRRAAFLAEAGAMLVGTLDDRAILRDTARLAVPFLADWCIADLREEPDGLHRVAVVAADASQADSWQAILGSTEQNSHPIADAFRSGETIFLPNASPKHWRLEPDDPLVRLAIASAICIPLRARDRTLGVLTLLTAESGRTYTAPDLELAEELALRAALAVDNARLYHEAQAAIRLRDEFLSVAAHELKTPVTSLRGYAELARRQLDRGTAVDVPRLRRALQTIDEQTNKLARLVAQLLDVARLESGRLGVEPIAADLALLVRAIAEEAQRRTTRHTIDVIAPEVCEALFDPLRIEQVISNLLDNAIKYSPQGGPITIEVRKEAPDVVECAITDRGMGIPPEHRPHIFDRFHQAHQQQHLSGMGIGLYISRQIVELHGGHMFVEFPPTGGTRFVVRLAAAATINNQ
jgi:signal transduction histidine kinase/DNA-binding response OmpR family regulator